MKDIVESLRLWLENTSPNVATSLVIAGTLLSGAVAYLIAKRVIVALIRRMVKASRTPWDDLLVKAGFFSISAHVAPAFVIYLCGKIYFDSEFLGDPGVGGWL